jgi:hypothetical protein
MDSEQIKPINKTIKHYKNNDRKNKTLKKHEHIATSGSTGGEVIDSGGYGCIFKPGLKCKSRVQSKNKSEISKLMLSHHARHEYNEIEKYKHLLESIPNYADYYLLDGITLCAPSKLSKTDLKQYKRKCRALQKRDIQKTNINESLDKLLSLNMPDGGEDIGNYLRNMNNSLNASTLVNINDSLIDLLTNGIVPMNNHNVYHCDVKESNILVKNRKNTKNGLKLYTRLIDWGLSTEYDKTKEQDIPKALSNRPFQYNLPFSVVLFNKRLHELYEEFLDETPNPEYSLVNDFVTDYVILWLKERGTGHFKVIDEIVHYMFDKDEQQGGGEQDDDYMNIGKYARTYNYIINYLAEILRKYTLNGKLHLLDYFNNVFIKNVDIWGFAMSYLPILEDLYFNYNKLNEHELKAFKKIKKIIIVFLFETATDPIDVEDLTEELRELGSTFQKVEQNNPQTGDQNLLKVEKNNDKNMKKMTSTILTDTSASI